MQRTYKVVGTPRRITAEVERGLMLGRLRDAGFLAKVPDERLTLKNPEGQMLTFHRYKLAMNEVGQIVEAVYVSYAGFQKPVTLSLS